MVRCRQGSLAFFWDFLFCLNMFWGCHNGVSPVDSGEVARLLASPNSTVRFKYLG